MVAKQALSIAQFIIYSTRGLVITFKTHGVLCFTKKLKGVMLSFSLKFMIYLNFTLFQIE